VRFCLSIDDLANTWGPYLTMSEGFKLTAQLFTWAEPLGLRGVRGGTAA